MTFCYINKSEPCSVIIRESIGSSCSRWEQIQRPTSRQHERVGDLRALSPKWESPSNPSLWVPWSPAEEGQKECKSQKGSRTPRKQDLLNPARPTHIQTHRLRHAQDPHRSAPDRVLEMRTDVISN